MGRSRSTGAFAGYGLPLIIGGAAWLANSAYRVVPEAGPAMAAAAGLAVLAWLLIRTFGRRHVGADAAPVAKASVSAGAYSPVATAGSAVDVRRAAATRWVSQDEAVKVQGSRIAGGLFYLGEAVVLPGGKATTQYAINPKLQVATSNPDVSGASMPYWPSYAGIAPQARRAFLDWMQSGRKDPAYGIGHVFLHFYGLEHRLFIDPDKSSSERIVAEVRRLLAIYGNNGSFRKYASALLGCAAVTSGVPIATPKLSTDLDKSAEIPPGVRYHLGAKLASSNRLGADDALLWRLSLPNRPLRTPAIRCFDDFVSLWRLRFAEKFPEGCNVDLPKTRLVVRYRAASGAFEMELPGPHTKYPDIAAASFPEPLSILADSCSDELDSYSRHVGRHPEGGNSIEAVLLLPKPLRRGAAAIAARALDQRIVQIMDGRSTATTTFRDLLQAAAIELRGDGQLPRPAAEQLCHVLDMLDIAIEPDLRYGGSALHPDDHVVIFKAERGGSIDAAKPAYREMKVRVEVAALAAAADGDATSEELQAVIADIQSGEGLTRLERLRLIAYAVTVFKSPPKRGRIMRRLAETPEPQRKAIAAAAAGVVAANGQIDSGGVRFLEKLNKSLGLPAADVYSDLHRRNPPADEPVPVSVENRVPGIPIPRVPDPPAAPKLPGGVRIDLRRLATVRKDTENVSTILSGIFADEPEAPATPATRQVERGDRSPLDGLDRGHAELVQFMALKGKIGRREFESRARELRLLPDGAIEKINDWSFDRFDEALLEDGDQVVLSPHLRERLAEVQAAAS